MERKQNSYNLHRMTQERIHTNTMYSKAVCLAREVKRYMYCLENRSSSPIPSRRCLTSYSGL